MSDWRLDTLGHAIRSLDAGVSVNAEDKPHGSGEIGVLKTSAVSDGRFFPIHNKTVVQHERRLVAEPVAADSILVSRMNTPALVGASCYVANAHPTLFLPDRLWQLKPVDRTRISMRWLSFVLQSTEYRRYVEVHATGTSGSMKNLPKAKLLALPVRYPEFSEQVIIGEVLDTIDIAIQQTDAIIAKLKAVKQGLLHDLLTRGVDADGELRPPQSDAPHLYQAGPLGWMPLGWTFSTLKDAAESIIDGPFGSNLKTEHYVSDPGVRVVRLQNIQRGEYDDTDRAFISDKHAASLARNRVTAGDALIASLGDDNYPVGRSCLYPADLPDAVNKADCFRFRGTATCRNAYVALFMNTLAARRQIRGYEQGVTMKRINLGNLKRVCVSLPRPAEQDLIVERAATVAAQVDAHVLQLRKLQHQRLGLSDDLLTGRVRVSSLLTKMEQPALEAVA